MKEKKEGKVFYHRVSLFSAIGKTKSKKIIRKFVVAVVVYISLYKN